MTKEERHKRRSGGSKDRTESFRKQLVLTVLEEELTLNEAAKRFGIPNQTISRWVLRYYDEIEQTSVIGSMNHSAVSSPESPQEFMEYESKLRKAQLKITALETMIELAEDTYKIAIRKNSGTKQPK